MHELKAALKGLDFCCEYYMAESRTSSAKYGAKQSLVIKCASSPASIARSCSAQKLLQVHSISMREAKFKVMLRGGDAKSFSAKLRPSNQAALLV